MLKRMLLFVGGLLAVGALIVAPTGAGASPIAMSGGGGSGCQDHYPPQSSWGNGWHGQDQRGRYWRGWGDGNGYSGGHAWDSSCTAFDDAGKVARVMLAVQRERGSQCRNLVGSRGLGGPTDCSHPHWFRAQGSQHWHHNITTPLPSGRYRLRHRAIDSAGNRGRVHSMHLRIR